MVDVGALVGLGLQLFEDIPYSNGGIMMAVNTDNKKKIKELILIIVASLAAVIIYHAAASGIERIVPDIFLSAFLAEAVFAVLTLVIVLAFKKTYIFKNDRTRLKSGWPSAGLLFVMMLFYLVMGLGNLIDSTATGQQWLLLLGHCVLIGFCEETLFRGLIQRQLHSIFKEDSFKHVFLAITCTGVIFGLTHMINLTRGTAFLSVAFQAIINIFSGIYYCAVFYRVGKNLWFMVILHGVYDLIGLINQGRLNGTALGDVIAPQQITGKSFGLGVLVLGGLYLLASIFVLRPKKLISLISE